MKDQSSSKAIIQDDEVDIREFFSVVWEGKFWILFFILIASGISIRLALSLPDVYKSEAFLSSNVGESSALNSLSSKYGGLASLAGISIPSSGTNKTVLAIEILKSRAFIGEFIENHNLLPNLMAAKSWNLDTGELVLDSDIYDVEKGIWIAEEDNSLDAKPSPQQAYGAFSEVMDVSFDEDTGFMKLAIQHLSPIIAQQWVAWLVEDINEEIRKDDVEQAKRSIKFLEQQIEATSLTELKVGFFELIQQQTETIMLANANPEYLFKTIDPAIVPEQRFKPKRAKICVFGAFLGLIIGIVFATIKHYISRNK